MEEKSLRPGYFYPGHSFLNNLLLQHQSNAQGQSNAAIATLITNFAKSYLPFLLALAEKQPLVQKYCNLEQSTLMKFWDEQLSSNAAFNALQIDNVVSDFVPQPGISSFSLIQGSYWFVKATAQYSTLGAEGNHFFPCAEKAVAYGSYHAGCLLLEAFLKTENSATTLQFSELENQLSELAKLQRTPGYLLLAKLYANKKMTAKGHACLDKAEELFDASKQAIQNSQCSPKNMRALIANLRQRLGVAADKLEAKSSADKIVANYSMQK